MHAEVAVPARDRARLEHLCRYVCRPPIAQDRLEETATGKLRYTLKKPWRDGTVALVLEPLDLLARVCALIPPPRFHMIRYHGVLSSHAKARAEVVPHVEELPVQLPLFNQGRGADRDLDVLAPEPRKKPWAWLLRHVFEIDVTTCPRCGGATRWLEAATKPESRGCSRSMASARGPHRRGQRHEGSCGSRYLARERANAERRPG